jgi:hypothetical protein
MRLISTFIVAVSVVGLAGCASQWVIPYGKTQNDFVMDQAYCQQFSTGCHRPPL